MRSYSVDMEGSSSRPLVFLILLIFSTGAVSAAEIELSAGAAGLVTRADGYPALLQDSAAVRLGVRWPLGTVARLGFEMLIGGAHPSDASGWFAYRGWAGWGLEATGSASWQVATWAPLGSLRIGAAVSAGAAMLSYQSTTVAFFCPTVEAAAELRYVPASEHYLDVSLEVPVRAWLRPDLSYCISLGLGFGVSLSTSLFEAAP